jgi:hypothetical protein
MLFTRAICAETGFSSKSPKKTRQRRFQRVEKVDKGEDDGPSLRAIN